MSKGKDLYVFVRFGGLDLKTQKGFGKETYHAPPTSRGFYAMPKVLQEFFLIGSLQETQPYNFPKCPKWKEDWTEEEKLNFDQFNWKEYEQKRQKVKSNIRKEFRKDKGFIWHHLIDESPVNEVVSRCNSWIKTSIKVWAKSIQKEVLNNRYGIGMFATKTVNNARFSGFYSRDHFEVFFDEKV